MLGIFRVLLCSYCVSRGQQYYRCLGSIFCEAYFTRHAQSHCSLYHGYLSYQLYYFTFLHAEENTSLLLLLPMLITRLIKLLRNCRFYISTYQTPPVLYTSAHRLESPGAKGFYFKPIPEESFTNSGPMGVQPHCSMQARDQFLFQFLCFVNKLAYIKPFFVTPRS